MATNYIKVRPYIARRLNLTDLRSTYPDGNVQLYEKDLSLIDRGWVFGRRDDTVARIGGLLMDPWRNRLEHHRAPEDCAPLPIPTDPDWLPTPDEFPSEEPPSDSPESDSLSEPLSDPPESDSPSSDSVESDSVISDPESSESSKSSESSESDSPSSDSVESDSVESDSVISDPESSESSKSSESSEPLTTNP